MPEACLVCVTAPNRDAAERIAKAAVEERLAACANLLGDMRSAFFWQGETRLEDETALLLKTAQDRLEALTARIRELHPYEEPCVVALPVIGGSESFIAWIVAETRPQAG